MASQAASKNGPRCQVEGCDYDLTSPEAGHYYCRKRICPDHMQALVVHCAKYHGGPTRPHRFCQQCGRLQPLKDFQGDKRSCQHSLNRRRNHMRSIIAAAKANISFANSVFTSSSTEAEAATRSGSKDKIGTKSSSRRPASSNEQQQHKDEEEEDAAHGAPASRIARRGRKASRRFHPYAAAAAAAAADSGGDGQLMDLLAADDGDTAAAAAAAPQAVVGRQMSADLNRTHSVSTAACSTAPPAGVMSMLPVVNPPPQGAWTMAGPADVGGAAALATASAAAGPVPNYRQPPIPYQSALLAPPQMAPAVHWHQQQQLLPAQAGCVSDAAPAAAARMNPAYTAQVPNALSGPQNMRGLAAGHPQPGLMPAALPGSAALPGFAGPSLGSQILLSGPMPAQHQLLPALMASQAQLPAASVPAQPQPLAAPAALGVGGGGAAPAAGPAAAAGFNPPAQQLPNGSIGHLLNQLIAEIEADASDEEMSASLPSEAAEEQDISMLIEQEMQRELALQQQQQQQRGALASTHSAAAAVAPAAAATASVNGNHPTVTGPQQQMTLQQQQLVSVAGSMPARNNRSPSHTTWYSAASSGLESQGQGASVAFAAALDPAPAVVGARNGPNPGFIPHHAAAAMSGAPAAAPAVSQVSAPTSQVQSLQFLLHQAQQAPDPFNNFNGLAPPAANGPQYHNIPPQQSMQAFAQPNQVPAGVWPANSVVMSNNSGMDPHVAHGETLARLGQQLAVCVGQLQALLVQYGA